MGFKAVLENFKTNSMNIKMAGTADVLLYMLGPAVVAFCVPVYSRKNVLKKNILPVIIGVLVASLSGLYGAAVFARLFQFASPVVRISALPRFITTALAIPVSNILGGNVPIAASLVVLTGVFAGSVGPASVDFFGIKSPISRGLSVGGAGNALGAASMIPEAEAFPFAISSMILTAAMVTILVSIPAFRENLLSVALGN
jgi:putative effector of murein hydrolase